MNISRSLRAITGILDFFMNIRGLTIKWERFAIG